MMESTILSKLVAYLEKNNLRVDYMIFGEGIKATVIVLTNGQKMIFNEKGEPVYIYE